MMGDQIFEHGLCVLADSTFCRIGRVGCAHDIAITSNGVLAFENLNDNRTRGHEVNQFAKERAIFMHSIECAGISAAQPQALLGNDAQAGLFDHGIHRARQVAFGSIWFDDRECALGCHD